MTTETSLSHDAGEVEERSVPRTSGVVVSGSRLLSAIVRHAPGRVALVFLMTLAQSVTSGIGLLMLIPMLGIAGLDVDEGSIGQMSQWVAQAFGAVGLSATVPSVLGVYLVIVTASAMLSRAHTVRTAMLYEGFVMHLRRRLYAAITFSSWSYYSGQAGSTFVHALTHELERVGGLTASVVNFVAKSIMVVLYVALALYLSPPTTLLVLATGGILMALLSGKTRRGRAKGEAVSAAYQALYGAIAEHLAGLRVSKSHGTEAIHVDRFGERTAQTADSLVGVIRNQADVTFWLQVGSATILALIFYVALVVLAFPLAGILLLLYLFARLVPMVTDLQRHVQQALNLLPAFDRTDAVLRGFEARAEAIGTQTEAPKLAREIRFESVSFGYDPADPASILRRVHLVLAAGRTTAIVGPSGAGKSTLADLAVGLLTPTEGRVSVDGVPLEGASVKAWRRRIGYVNQDTFLFNDSIRENLLAVRPEATPEDVIEALRASAAEFVLELPDGIDTIVGDRGLRLSGGERQRIALARALLRRPDLLVLDEATSALDAENENVIQDAIERMAGAQTILLIAHRLASVRLADTIVVMEGGRVVESGTWDGLLRNEKGRFRALCLAQGISGPDDLESRPRET